MSGRHSKPSTSKTRWLPLVVDGSQFFILPFQGVKLYIVPFYPGRCPGLVYFALLGRKKTAWSIRLTFLENWICIEFGFLFLVRDICR